MTCWTDLLIGLLLELFQWHLNNNGKQPYLYIHLTKYCLNARTSISVIIVQSGQCCSFKKPSCRFSTETVFADVFSASLIASYDLIPLPVSLLDLVSIEKIYQTLKQCLTIFPNTSRFVRKTPLRVVFSALLRVFGNVPKHGTSFLINYVTHTLSRVWCVTGFSSGLCTWLYTLFLHQVRYWVWCTKAEKLLVSRRLIENKWKKKQLTL